MAVSANEPLLRIEQRFHDLIRQRAAEFEVPVPEQLPDLSALANQPGQAEWFPVPGLYGGFHYWLDPEADHPRLIAESWCRVCGGSGQRHAISADETVLLEEGFV